MNAIDSITVRALLPTDEAFSYQVYASTRQAEMELVDWSPTQREAFLHMQWEAQTRHYRSHYAGLEYQVIQFKALPVGRLILARSMDSLLIVDIALLPEYRNAGIGTAVLENLMNEATRLALPIVLRVEFFNPARNLYQRLGFVRTRELNIYQEMVWTSNRNDASSSSKDR